MRSGIVDDIQEKNYNLYKVRLFLIAAITLAFRLTPTLTLSPSLLSSQARLKERCESDRSDCSLAFYNTSVLELSSRHGYGFALKAALQEVKSKYVIVIQHDRNFMRPAPVREVVNAMEVDEEVKYVGILMRSNLMYLEQFVAKYGKAMLQSLKSCIKRPQELRLDPRLFTSKEVAERVFDDYPRISEKYRNLCENYKKCPPYAELKGEELSELEGRKGCSDADGDVDGDVKCQASLIPTLFWYDNVHITRTEHYRDWVFKPERKLVKRGGFVEDKLSPKMVEDVKSRGFAEGWSPYGCFLVDDHCGVAFTGHMDGGAWMTGDMRVGRMDSWVKQNGKSPQEGKDLITPSGNSIIDNC